MIVWSVLLGLAAGWLDGFFIPAWHWPPLFSVFCAVLVFMRRGHRGGKWIFIVSSGLWLDLVWMVPIGVFIIWHAIIYGLAALGGRYGNMVLLYALSFIYFLGLFGLELILGRPSGFGLAAAAAGALTTGSGVWLARYAARSAGRLIKRWFFIKTG